MDAVRTEPRLAPQSGLLSNGCGGHAQALPQKMYAEEITQLFEKKFHYQKNGERPWQLPDPKELFGEYYQLDTLQELKERLNTVKCKLNNYIIEDWSAHTRRKDPSGEIPWKLKNETKAEFVTIAWCKFYECLNKFPLVKVPQMNTLHLCEAPGAFIAALNHYLFTNYEKEEVRWNWLSTTLNPYYEGNPLNKMITDDRFMLYTLDHWLFHDDFTGNIMSRENIEDMRQKCKEKLDGEVQLITADGSIDCVEAPDCQEEYVAPLHFAEITAALSILAEGGNFVFKMFTLFESVTVCKLFLLNCAFEEVHVFKPATSKRGNSEVYVICLNYRKQTKHLQPILELMKAKMGEGSGNVLPLFAKAHIPRDFLVQHEICARLFMNLQIQAIEENIYAYEIKPPHDARRSHQLRTQVCNEYYQRYRIQPVPEELTILYRRHGIIQTGIKAVIYKGSHTERETLKTDTPEEQIFRLRGELNEVEKLVYGRYGVLLDEHFDVQETMPLKVYKGAEFDTLHSSLFANVHVLLFRIKLQQLFAIEPMWNDAPKCVLDASCKVEVPLDYGIDENYSLVQQQFLISVLDAMLKYKPQRLIFENMPFLTHLMVSVLRFLALNVFHNLNITTEPHFSITLCRKDEYDAGSIRQISSLRQLIHDERRALCLVDIIHLHRNEFYRALSEYNNLLLLKNFKLILHN